MLNRINKWLNKPLGTRLELTQDQPIGTQTVVEILRSKAMTAQQYDLINAFIVEMNSRN
jgi:hypothetical protein